MFPYSGIDFMKFIGAECVPMSRICPVFMSIALIYPRDVPTNIELPSPLQLQYVTGQGLDTLIVAFSTRKEVSFLYVLAY